MRVLVALALEPGPATPKALQHELELPRGTVSHGLYALLIVGLAERGGRVRGGRLWGLTDRGRQVAERMVVAQ